MSGPICHKKSQKCLKKFIESWIPYDIKVWGKIGQLKPDTEGVSHGYNIFKDQGLLLALIENYTLQIRQLFNNFPNNNANERFQELVLYLNHYCVDIMTMGQICGQRYWGWNGDNQMDAAGALVSNKREFCGNFQYLFRYEDLDKIMALAENWMYDTYRIYKHDARKWTSSWWQYVPFYLSRHVAHMYKRAVYLGARLTAECIWWAYFSRHEDEEGNEEDEKGKRIRKWKEEVLERREKQHRREIKGEAIRRGK